ncbi:hypothetical protein LMG3431_02341 [Achromobacter pestifer]|uniref:Uncharacterized protein n=1 Tax=Achromobacter pestifer TaxID=1353889 RepID=A0A6S6YTN7_9BURK|nr:hypothetical protein LMG3431_02341 [Achromobacter pestifer]
MFFAIDTPMLAAAPAPVALTEIAPVTAEIVAVLSALTDTPVPAVMSDPSMKPLTSLAAIWVPSAPDPLTDTPLKPAATDAATDTPSSAAVSRADTATLSDTLSVEADTPAFTLTAAMLLATDAPTDSEPPCIANANDAPMALASSVVLSSAPTVTRVICALAPDFSVEFDTDASTAPRALLLARATPTESARPCAVPARLAPAAVAFNVDVFDALTLRLSAARTLGSICVSPSTLARVTARDVLEADDPAAANATPL